MATAGRVLIIPKGKYNAETQYESLDMVSHGGKGWVCKKTCIGIEPTEGEYWAECIDVSDKFGELSADIVALDSKVNPLKTVYIMEDNIDDILDSTTPQYPYIFGHSDKLGQLYIGYWVCVETFTPIGGHIYQKAMAEGGTATRYYNSDMGWTPWNVTAKKSDTCWIKTITATSTSNGVALVANSANGETPLSVICDTDGYYVGRLFKNQHGLWYATIFDVATVQAVTSETEVTLYATMKPK